MGMLLVNGKKIISGEETDVFSKAGSYVLKAGNKSYNLEVMKAENTASMFLTTDEYEVDYINEEKGNCDSGKVLITKADGSVGYENSC